MTWIGMTKYAGRDVKVKAKENVIAVPFPAPHFAKEQEKAKDEKVKVKENVVIKDHTLWIPFPPY